MRIGTLNCNLAIGAMVSAITVGALATFAFGEEQEETSLLLNRPIQSASDLPALPPPVDPESAAPDREQVLPSPTKARPASSDRPFMRPVESDTVSETLRLDRPQGAGPLPMPTNDGPIVHPVHQIKYDTDRGARKLYASSGGVIDTVLVTQNPADGCLYEIPVCLPACCVGEPLVESRRGLLGRGVVEYCWPCGLEVEVIFRLRGDVKVEYDG